jgi:hypothetical protein
VDLAGDPLGAEIDPNRFQTEPPACDRAFLAATRTGLTPAGGDEVTPVCNNTVHLQSAGHKNDLD